jgi:hypothetical protein
MIPAPGIGSGAAGSDGAATAGVSAAAVGFSEGAVSFADAGGDAGFAGDALPAGDRGASAPMDVSASRQFVALVGAASRAEGAEGAAPE